MTEYQLLYLRFLRMKADMPHLKHDGHEPEPTTDALFNGAQSLPRPKSIPLPMGRVRQFGIDATPKTQRRLVEREFYRAV